MEKVKMDNSEFPERITLSEDGIYRWSYDMNFSC